MEKTEINHIVNVFNVKSSIIQVKGKVNAVNLGERSLSLSLSKIRTETDPASNAVSKKSQLSENFSLDRLLRLGLVRLELPFVHDPDRRRRPDRPRRRVRRRSSVPLERVGLSDRDRQFEMFGVERERAIVVVVIE